MMMVTMMLGQNHHIDGDDFDDEDKGDCVTDRWHSSSSEGRSPAQRNPRPDIKPVFSFKEFSLGDHCNWVIIG